MSPTLLLLLLLAQAGGPDAAPEAAPVAAASAEPWHYVARGEATTLALLPRGGAGAREGFLQVEPTFIWDGGKNWGLNVGAPVRVRLSGGEPGAGLVRREDWDSLSDWGQLVRGLKLGSDHAPVALWVGGLSSPPWRRFPHRSPGRWRPRRKTSPRL